MNQAPTRPKADYRDVPDAIELEQAILDAEREHKELLRVIREVRLLLKMPTTTRPYSEHIVGHLDGELTHLGISL